MYKKSFFVFLIKKMEIKHLKIKPKAYKPTKKHFLFTIYTLNISIMLYLYSIYFKNQPGTNNHQAIRVIQTKGES